MSSSANLRHIRREPTMIDDPARHTLNFPKEGQPAKAAIIGLGQVGSRFDEEPGRVSVWSHTGAYLACPGTFSLVAGCEKSPENAEAFRARCPGIPVFEDIEAMLRQHQPAVVSVCTPADSHWPVVEKILACRSVRVIWCEKPLTASIDEGRRLVDACQSAGVVLVVSFVRRWLPLWKRARQLIAEGAVGQLRSVRIAIPNRLWSMGSHAVDLIHYLGGGCSQVMPFVIPALAEAGEPAVAAFFQLDRGAYGIFQVTGWKANYLVEGEVIGDDGRLIVREHLNSIMVEKFEPSSRYKGYRDPGPASEEIVALPATYSPFVAIAEEIGEMLAGLRTSPTCDGSAALAVQSALETMATAVPKMEQST